MISKQVRLRAAAVGFWLLRGAVLLRLLWAYGQNMNSDDVHEGGEDKNGGQKMRRQADQTQQKDFFLEKKM